jgi:hypothetical protein
MVLDGATQELLALPVMLPSPFLEEAIKGLKDKVMEYKRVMADLEQVGGGGVWGGAMVLGEGGVVGVRGARARRSVSVWWEEVVERLQTGEEGEVLKRKRKSSQEKLGDDPGESCGS